MVGEELGWYPIDGWGITAMLFAMVLVIMLPGFLLSLAIFPKRKAMSISERLALSFGLGLFVPFLLTMLNIALELQITLFTSLVLAIAISALSVFAFAKRGGRLCLRKWYADQ